MKKLFVLLLAAWLEMDHSDTQDFTDDYPVVTGFELGYLAANIRLAMY